jgi:hypothetical protein
MTEKVDLISATSFLLDRMRQQSYREGLVDAIGHPSAVSPDAER